MPQRHPHAESFIEHLRTTQEAYAERRLQDYLAGFAEDYSSVQLHTNWSEDKTGLRRKIELDFQRFKLISMEFEVVQDWFSGEVAYALLRYHTRLGLPDERVLVDRRENILVCRHKGSGRWEIISKIIVRAENYYE
jgi:hypothetical protein